MLQKIKNRLVVLFNYSLNFKKEKGLLCKNRKGQFTYYKFMESEK